MCNPVPLLLSSFHIAFIQTPKSELRLHILRSKELHQLLPLETARPREEPLGAPPALRHAPEGDAALPHLRGTGARGRGTKGTGLKDLISVAKKRREMFQVIPKALCFLLPCTNPLCYLKLTCR